MDITPKTTTDNKNRQQQIFSCKEIKRTEKLWQDEKIEKLDQRLAKIKGSLSLLHPAEAIRNRETDHHWWQRF